MKVNTETSGTTKSTLIVSLDTSDIEATKNRIVSEMSRNLKVSGFRTGNVPPHIAIKELDSNALQGAFLSDFVPKVTQQALDLKKIRPVLRPEVSVTKFVPYDSLEIEIKVEHLGEIKLAEYSQMSETMPAFSVEVKDVADVLERIQLDFATLKDVDRVSQKGDRVWIDFAGVDENKKPVPGASATDHPLLLGGQSFIEGFEEKLIGQTKGKKLAFKLRFPKDYIPTSLADKVVHFEVEIKRIQEVTDLPKIDKDLAAKIGPFKSVAALKKFVEQQILKDKGARAKSLLQGRIVAKLSEQSHVEIPEGLMKAEIESLHEEHRNYLTKNKLELKTWLEDVQLTQKEHEDKIKKAASARIKGGLVLREITLKEKLEVTNEEVTARLKQQSTASLSEQEIVDLRQDVRAHLLTRKALDKLTEIVVKPSVQSKAE